MESKAAFTGDYVRAMDSLPVARFRWLLPKLELELAAHPHVVDYGCGSGRLLDCIHDRVAHYLGVDFSPEFVSFARERVAKLGIRNASFECDEIVGFCARHQAEFDLGFTIDFAGYLDDAAFVELYGAMRSSLKPGGKLVLYMANGRYIVELLKRRGLFPKPKAPYLAVRNREQYLRLLREAGFERIDVAFTPHFKTPRIPDVLSGAPVVGKYLQAKILLICER
jgi:SAM-dependent methyltransferase